MEYKNQHINDIEMALYASGHRHFPKDVLVRIGNHLKGCTSCRDRFDKAFEEAVQEKKIEARIGSKPKGYGIDIRKKLIEAYNNFVQLLSTNEIIVPNIKQTGMSTLLTAGYMYTSPSAKKKRKKTIKSDLKPIPLEDNIKICDCICSLLEIFTNKEIPISKRVIFAEELLLLAQEKLQNIKTELQGAKLSKRTSYKKRSTKLKS